MEEARQPVTSEIGRCQPGRRGHLPASATTASSEEESLRDSDQGTEEDERAHAVDDSGKVVNPPEKLLLYGDIEPSLGLPQTDARDHAAGECPSQKLKNEMQLHLVQRFSTKQIH